MSKSHGQSPKKLDHSILEQLSSFPCANWGWWCILWVFVLISINKRKSMNSLFIALLVLISNLVFHIKFRLVGFEKLIFLQFFIPADQDSVRLLAVEGCAALGKLLETQDCVAHILPVIVNFSQVDRGWWILCYNYVRICELVLSLSYFVTLPHPSEEVGANFLLWPFSAWVLVYTSAYCSRRLGTYILGSQ